MLSYSYDIHKLILKCLNTMHIHNIKAAAINILNADAFDSTEWLH